jgi:hypothetical protein
MADPTPYEPGYSFTGFEAINPTQPKPGPQLDAEFENIATSLSETIDGLKDLRRSDGALKDGIVTFDSLSPEVAAELSDNVVVDAEAARDAAQASASAAAGSASAASGSASAVLASANAAEAARQAAEDIQETIEFIVSDVVGALVIPCTAVWNSELGPSGTITLTPLIEYPALVAGLIFRFRSPSPITQAGPLIRIGSTFYGGLKNRTGTTVPGAYVRTDLDTILTFDGTNFRAGREIERGSNANGGYVRFEDGTQICSHALTCAATNTALGSIFRSNDESWTYPVAFSTTDGLTVKPSVQTGGRWANVFTTNTNNCTFRQFNAQTNASTSTIKLEATGRWY